MNTNTNNSSTYNPSAQPNSHDDEINLAKLFGELIDKKFTILFTTVVFGFFGFIYGQVATPIYKSNALIQVEDNSNSMMALDDIGDIFAAESTTDTEIYILKSRNIIGQTVDDLGLTLNIKPKYFPIIGKYLENSYQGEELANPVFGTKYAWGGERLVVSEFRVSKPLLEEELVIIAADEQKFSLWFDNEKILEGVAGSLASNIKYGVSIKVDQISANKGTEFSVSKSSRLNTILDLQLKVKAVSLGKDTGIMELSILGSNKDNISAILNSISNNYVKQNVQRLGAEAENSLNFINGQLPMFKASLNQAERALNSYRAVRESVDLSLETQSLLESLVKLEADISSMALNEAEVSRRFTKEHPNYVSFKRQQADLISQRNRLNLKIGSLPETQQKILTLMRDFEVNQAIYLSLQNKSQELAIVKASTVGNVRILDSSEVFPIPTSPKKALILVISTLIGGMLSVLFVLLRSAFNPGIKSTQEFQDIGLNVLAAIPVSQLQLENDSGKKGLNKNLNNHSNDELFLAIDQPTDLSIEALRSLRTSLHFAMMSAKNNVLMVSSGTAEVGKSFVCSNLSAIIAQSGKRVLLVDADLRRGFIHRKFSSTLGLGLSEYLCGSASLADIIKRSKDDNLEFITRGAIPPNPSELLMTDKFETFVEQVSKDYDYVIIDTPPILAVTDAAVIGKFVGTTMMIARFEKSTLMEVSAAVDRFNLNGIEIKGVIFNAIEARAAGYYGGYNYYNYSYQSDTIKD